MTIFRTFWRIFLQRMHRKDETCELYIGWTSDQAIWSVHPNFMFETWVFCQSRDSSSCSWSLVFGQAHVQKRRYFDFLLSKLLPTGVAEILKVVRQLVRRYGGRKSPARDLGAEPPPPEAEAFCNWYVKFRSLCCLVFNLAQRWYFNYNAKSGTPLQWAVVGLPLCKVVRQWLNGV